MDTTDIDKITANFTSLKGFAENLKRLSFLQEKTKDIIECMRLQYEEIIKEAKIITANEIKKTFP